MDIVVGINRADEVEAVVSAGARLVYCGVFDRRWSELFTPACPAINRRPYSEKSNLRSVDELTEATRIAHAVGAELALTLNDHYYTDAQQPLLRWIVQQAMQARVDAVLISDPGLLLLLQEENWRGQIHISTSASAYNSAACSFYFKQGASRVVLPRHLTVREIKAITAAAPGFYESFIMNCGCYFEDSLCGFEHALHFFSECGGAGCALAWTASGVPANYRGPAANSTACGGCAIPLLRRAGVSAVKIVSREYDLLNKIRDVLYIRCLIAAMEDMANYEGYCQYARGLYAKLYGESCTPTQCYYADANAG